MNLDTLRVLYIEDDPGLSRLLKKNLERLGNFSVEVASSGEEGLEKLASSKYDIALVDQNMPGCSGTEVIRVASAVKNAPPFIMVTSSDSASVATEALKSGAEDFICKDAETEYLKVLPSMIGQVIEKAKHREEHKRMQLEIKENEKRFRKLVELSPDGIAILDDLNFSYVNPSAAKLLQKKASSELLGSSFAKFLPKSEHDKFKDLVKLMRSGAPVPWIEFALKVEGKTFHVELSAVEYMWKNKRAMQIIFRDISIRKELQGKLEALAYYDNLTSLPNRKYMTDKLLMSLKKAEAGKLSPAIMFLDLDKFKSVNDTAGHDAGDLLLREIATRLKSLVRAGDVVARIGGDEFVVILTNAESLSSVHAVADRIIQSVNLPVECEYGTFHVGTSIGISYFGKNGRSAEELIKAADDAMYLSKENGKNCYTDA